MSHSSSNHSAHWSDYWSSGALTSLPQDFSGNYDGEVAEFWKQQFNFMSESGRLLDVCTGNGPIALLAARTVKDEGLQWSIDAVDAAQPDLEVLSQRPDVDSRLLDSIQFTSNTRIENLPFEDHSFDLVTSQYGLEYSDLSLSAAEIARVLRPEGRLVFVHHAADSEILQTMTAEAADYQKLNDVGLLKLVRSWSRGQLSEVDFQKRIQVPLRRLAQLASGTKASPLLIQVAQSFQGLVQLPMTSLRQQKPAAAEYARQLESGLARLRDMMRVNQMIAGQSDWTQPLKYAGLSLLEQGEVLYRQTHRMGGYQVWSAS